MDPPVPTQNQHLTQIRNINEMTLDQNAYD